MTRGKSNREGMNFIEDQAAHSRALSADSWAAERQRQEAECWRKVMPILEQMLYRSPKDKLWYCDQHPKEEWLDTLGAAILSARQEAGNQ